jgi:hypothetical protein
MTTTPNNPTADENDDEPTESAAQDDAAQDDGAPGAEVGMSDDGSTFEPEEDPEGYS